jgi:MoaA/NifB/PqqE/SkfB family radical SAM enzyme
MGSEVVSNIQEQKSTDKFCPVPWYHIVIDTNGSIRPCCRYAQPGNRPDGYVSQIDHPMPNIKDGQIDDLWNGPQLRKLRRAFINGEQPTECDQCWSEEQSNITSYRQSISAWNKHMFNHIDFTSELSDQPTSFDLKLSNICNLKCRMCSPQASSSILKELRRLNMISEDDDGDYWLSHKIYDTPNESIFRAWIANTRNIELTGGEPFVSPENKKLIEEVSQSPYANRVRIQVNTNVTHYIGSIVEQFKNFQKAIVIASIDDVGPRLEYARSGAVWKTIDQNLKKYAAQDHITLMIKCTVNNYNIWYLEDIINYADEVGVKIEFDFVYEPPQLSIKNLHPLVKAKIKDKYLKSNYLSSKLHNVLSFLDASDVDLTNDFLEYTIQYDKHRSENFADVFSDWNAELDVEDNDVKHELITKVVSKYRKLDV